MSLFIYALTLLVSLTCVCVGVCVGRGRGALAPALLHCQEVRAAPRVLSLTKDVPHRTHTHSYRRQFIFLFFLFNFKSHSFLVLFPTPPVFFSLTQPCVMLALCFKTTWFDGPYISFLFQSMLLCYANGPISAYYVN